MQFELYPFEKLSNLLDCIEPNSEYSPLSLTIGEPQFDTPQFIQDELKNSVSLLNKYPKTAGEDSLKDALINYNLQRFGLNLSSSQIIPTFGTREVLFNFPQFLLHDKPSPVMAFPNPFYQIYEGAAVASRAKIIHMPLLKENDFLPIINEDELAQCDLVILNSPSNPCASVMSLESLKEWVRLALKYDFVLLNDECYIDLYIGDKIPSLLNASIEVGNSEFKNILVLNSISKRSSAPGLRSGFIAGDARILSEYMKYRTYVGCASPLPLQCAATVAWQDDLHVEVAREAYKANFILAKEILGIEMAKATFYIWLEVDDDLEFTKRLYSEYNLKVLAGSFLGRNGEGSGFVRLALVYDERKTKDALKRVKALMNKIKKGE
jgi:aspartate/methionine/tyrosine aminotransferase